MKVEGVTVGDAFGETHRSDDSPFSASLVFQHDRRRQKAFKKAEVSQAYEHLRLRAATLQDGRSKILRSIIYFSICISFFI